MVLLLMKKRTLFSKSQAVRAHEVKLVSWASQLSLQALIDTLAIYAGKLTHKSSSFVRKKA